MKAFLNMFSSLRSWLTLLSNLLVFYGIYAYDWSIFTVVMLFWSETIIMGFFNMLRVSTFLNPLVFYQDGTSKLPFRVYLGTVWFFALLVFTYGHGILIDGLLNENGTPGFPGPRELLSFLNDPDVQITFIAIAGYYAFDYLYNYLYKGERHQMVYQEFTLIPFVRVAILQFTIIIGALLVSLFKAPLLLLCVLVLIKILVELFLYNKSERYRDFFKKSNEELKARHKKKRLNT